MFVTESVTSEYETGPIPRGIGPVCGNSGGWIRTYDLWVMKRMEPRPTPLRWSYDVPPGQGRSSMASHLVQPAQPLPTASLLPFLLQPARGIVEDNGARLARGAGGRAREVHGSHINRTSPVCAVIRLSRPGGLRAARCRSAPARTEVAAVTRGWCARLRHASRGRRRGSRRGCNTAVQRMACQRTCPPAFQETR